MAKKLTDDEKETFRRLYESGARLLTVAHELDISETQAKRVRKALGLTARKRPRQNCPRLRHETDAMVAREPEIDYAALDARWASQAGGAWFEDVPVVRPWRPVKMDRAPATYSITGNSGGMCAP